MLLRAFASVRSEGQLMERQDTDLLYLWFVSFGVDHPAWDATVFSKNRDCLLDHA
jgi:transposase